MVINPCIVIGNWTTNEYTKSQIANLLINQFTDVVASCCMVLENKNVL